MSTLTSNVALSSVVILQIARSHDPNLKIALQTINRTGAEGNRVEYPRRKEGIFHERELRSILKDVVTSRRFWSSRGYIVSHYTIIYCPGSIPVPSKQTDSKTKAYRSPQPHDFNQRPHPFPHFSFLPLTCPKLSPYPA